MFSTVTKIVLIICRRTFIRPIVIIKEQDHDIVLVHELIYINSYENSSSNVWFITKIILSIKIKIHGFFQKGEITSICYISKDKKLAYLLDDVLGNQKKTTNLVYLHYLRVHSQSSRIALALKPLFLYYIGLKSNYIFIHSEDTQGRLKKITRTWRILGVYRRIFVIS